MSDDLFEDDYMNGTAEELAHGKKEVVEMPDKEFPESTVENTLAETLADCIKTARQAYTIAGENPSSEDLRALAITIFIDMGKDKRTATISKSKPRRDNVYTGEDAPKSVATDKPKVQMAEQPCPSCGEKMYDNRNNKRNPKGPDYKCTKCTKAGWIRTNGKTGVEFISWSD